MLLTLFHSCFLGLVHADREKTLEDVERIVCNSPEYKNREALSREEG